MDEDHHSEDPMPPAEDELVLSDQPVSLIPKSALAFYPRVGDPLDLLVDPGSGVVIGRSEGFHAKYHHAGLGLIGAIAESADDILESLLGMPVQLDLISPHVLFVAGKRGSGKSYTLGIIAEELARAMERREIEVAAVVIDTVDVFRQCVEPNEDQDSLLRKWNLEARGFPVSVYIPRRTYIGLPDEVKQRARLFPLAISPRELTAADWGYVLERGGTLSTAMDNLIGEVLDSLRRGYVTESGSKVSLKRDFSIKDMIACIETNPTILDLYQPATRTAMIQRLKRADRLGVFHPSGTSAQDLAVAGRITIIDVAPLGSEADTVLAILTNMLCRQVLTYRMAWTDEGTSAREELPPTWLIIDEAHTLVPKSGNTPAKDAIVGYAKLGRRFGCSLVLCTQQPSAVADEAISQADIILSHSLSHEADIRALQQRAPAVMPLKFRDKVFISSLPRGVAIVFDQTTENKRGFITQIRPRISQHGGTDRLSSLFEAVRLMIPSESIGDEGSADLELGEDELEIELEPSQLEKEETVELPVIPRPPLKLSKEDWALLDNWMHEYIEKYFDARMQDITITDESAPRAEASSSNLKWELPRAESGVTASYEPVTIEGMEVCIREFGVLSRTLLEKALTRKILYSETPHEFLFAADNKFRDSIAISRIDMDPKQLVELVIQSLVSSGMTLDSVKSEGGFSYVLLRKDGTRAGLSIGVSGMLACVSVVVTSESKKEAAPLMASVTDLCELERPKPSLIR
ncbi:MAG: ATP-binding protein [Candidatus Thorarchaeota archaeon]|nr:ATP-binding protein [Candidatus Thorarchaeota archaeon]